MVGAVPPAGQHLAAVRVHQPAGSARWLARLAGRPGVQQCGPPGEVYHPGAGTVKFQCRHGFKHFIGFTWQTLLAFDWNGAPFVLPLLFNLNLLCYAKFQVQPSVEDEHHLDQEIHNTVRKIIRDFVSSWYSTVSSESGFETEVQEAMISMAMELKIRARQVDRKVL